MVSGSALRSATIFCSAEALIATICRSVPASCPQRTEGAVLDSLALPLDRADLAAGVVVAQEEHPVAGGKLPAVEPDAWAELAGAAAGLTDAVVEPPDVGLAVGEDQARLIGREVAVFEVGHDQGIGGLVAVGMPLDRATLGVGRERGLEPAVGEVLRGFTLPLVGLPSDGVDAGGAVLLDEAAEGVARADRLELVRVSDQITLAPRS